MPDPSELDRKLDAIEHALSARIGELKDDIKEDLAEIKVETKETNGRVTGHDREIFRIKGMIYALGMGLPFVLFALSRLVT